MYLPSFYKLNNEHLFFKGKRYAMFALPISLWVMWCMHDSMYNLIYTDIIPPPKGVQRRIVEEEI